MNGWWWNVGESNLRIGECKEIRTGGSAGGSVKENGTLE